MSEPPCRPRRSGAPAAAGDDLVKDTTTQTFAKDVIEESRRQPVLVDFWAPWCGPCRSSRPIIEKAVRAAKGKVKLVKMNIDDHPAIAGQLGIQSIPAVIAFVNGQPVDGFIGALPESQVKAFIERLAGPDRPARPRTCSKRPSRASPRATSPAPPSSSRRRCRASPAIVPAIAGLARCLPATGGDRAGPADAGAGAGGQAQRPGGRRRPRRARARRAGGVARAGRRARAEGRGQSARPSGALRSRGGAQRPAATARRRSTTSSRSCARDRNWNDEAARKQLVQFFEAWGPTDEATVTGRRRLSSMLFA